MVKIYHNPRCTKSRETLKILETKTNNFEVIDYIKNSILPEELEQIVVMLGIDVDQLLRKNETVYKERFKNLELEFEELILAMIEYPKLMERPIVVKGDKAIIGRPPENVLKLFK